MSELITWFDMHGYANYIWSSYGLVFGVLMLNVWSIKNQSQRVKKQLKIWFKQ